MLVMWGGLGRGLGNFSSGRSCLLPIEPLIMSHIGLKRPDSGVHLIGGHMGVLDRLSIKHMVDLLLDPIEEYLILEGVKLLFCEVSLPVLSQPTDRVGDFD